MSGINVRSRSLERAIARIEETWGRSDDDYPSEYDRMDIVEVNLMRACESAIDLVNILRRRLRLPSVSSSREAFEDLAARRLLTQQTAEAMTAMVGFRNILVHDYIRVDRKIVGGIVTEHLESLLALVAEVQNGFNSAERSDVP